jgi:chemotaxis signal transduction protein
VQIAAEDIKPPSSTTGSTAAPYLAGHVVARQGAIAVLDVDRVLQC